MLRILTAGFFAMVFAASAAAQSGATIHVDVADKKAPVSPGLYGIFMEEISHAFDGGIYAELIQNRSFEEGVVPPGMHMVTNDDGSLRIALDSLPAGVPKDKWNVPGPWGDNLQWDRKRALVGWSLKNEGGATGEMQLTEENPMNAASTRSLEMTVAAPATSAGRVALVNTGYWGIHVERATSYDLKFHLLPGTFQGKVTASLESADGKILASHDFGTVKPGAHWKEFTSRLKATASDPTARFVLSFRGAGKLQVDWVSLFPPTFKNRPNGLKPELAKYLADLKPAFIRFPGGCYVEGFSWDQAPDWRKTVCPPEERPGQWGYWQYRSDDGFGYHEYLQFCEDIGAKPVYVAFAGMTVHPDDNVPLADLQPIIQRALDAIEYANGPTSTRWGAARAKMGHAKPFGLQYVEIGNEHETPLYGEYYVKFREAIKAKYPDVTVIMSMFWSGINNRAIARAGATNIDMVDEHAYHDDSWPRANFNYFDRYRRGPWSIYVGEYAAQRENGDWAGGMGDSLYLMMCERNGDLVKMASYAPLFCNVNHRDWPVNLIEYDSSRSFAHGSYYVQKTFIANRPDYNLATTAEVPKGDTTRPLLAGKLGLGAWNTRTEFKDLRVYDENGKLILSDDFTNLDNWATPGTGRWQADNGVLKQTGDFGTPMRLFLKMPDFKQGRITLKARRIGGEEGFLILFNSDGKDRFLFSNYGANGNKFSALQDHGLPDGLAFRGGRDHQGAIENDRWYDVSLTVNRDTAEMTLDGQTISTARVSVLPTFFAGAGYDTKNQSVIIKATNYQPFPVQTRIQLDGAVRVGATGRHIVIASDNLEGDNTLDDPRHIIPLDEALTGCSTNFPVTLPPYSVNVLRIPVVVK